MKKAYQLLMLFLSITSFIIQASCQEFNITMSSLQQGFNHEICGGCQGSILANDLCTQHRNHLEKQIKIDIGQESIIRNKLGIDLVKILIKTTTGNYTINGRNYTGIQTAYLTAMPILKNNSQYRGHIAYYHPTIFNKQLVPSKLTKSTLSIIAFWCSLGFSVTFYDGNGLGINYKLIHPYVLLPEVNVQNMYYCLNDTLKDLQDQYYAKNRDAIIKLYAVGYSQGGAYALWHYYCYYLKTSCPSVTKWINYKYQMEKASGLQGAHDPKGTVIPFLLANVTKKPNNYSIETQQLTTFAKPGLTAMALISFATYYHSGPLPLESLLNLGFFDMNCTQKREEYRCQVVNASNQARIHLNITEAFVQQSLLQVNFSLALTNSAFLKQMNGKTYPSRLSALYFTDNSNSIESFVNLKALYATNFNQTVEKASLTARILPNQTNILAWTLQEDSIVSPKNSNELKRTNKDINYFSFINENYKVCDDKIISVSVDHLRGQILGNLYTYLFFDGSLPKMT